MLSLLPMSQRCLRLTRERTEPTDSLFFSKNNSFDGFLLWPVDKFCYSNSFQFTKIDWWIFTIHQGPDARSHRCSWTVTTQGRTWLSPGQTQNLKCQSTAIHLPSWGFRADQDSSCFCMLLHCFPFFHASSAQLWKSAGPLDSCTLCKEQ